MQQKIEEELQEEELLEDLLHNQQITGLAQGKMSQNSSNETDSKMAKTGKQATSVNNNKQAAVQAGFGNLVSKKSSDFIGYPSLVFENPIKKQAMKPALPPVVIPPQWFIPENFVDYGSQSDISADSELSDRLSIISSMNGQFDGYRYASQSSGFFLTFKF